MPKSSFDRRAFLQTSALGSLALAGGVSCKTSAPSLKSGKFAKKVFVIGFDGMDPVLLRRFVGMGGMPNFAKLIEAGHLGELQTTMPPQSPVAWASFICGCNPGCHGIYDFIHRDPSNFVPYLSTSKTYAAEKTLDIGNWSIPLKGGRVELMRRGTPFWSVLEQNDIYSTVFKAPSNFPVDGLASQSISGMGTPDLLGTYGTFTYFTDAIVPNADSFTGGRVVPITADNHLFRTQLAGPPNSMRKEFEETAVPIEIARDPTAKIAKIKIDRHELILKPGEWSEWLPLTFEMIPLFHSVSGMVRLYLQEVHPYLRLYASPINIDPMDPVLPISSPTSYSKAVSQTVGRFYTQGFPQDTKALSHGVFSNEEYLAQAEIVLQERLKVFEHELNAFHEGLFFYYFASLDQNSHMMWRTMDPSHPLFDPEASEKARNAIHYFYKRMDQVIGRVMGRMDPDSTLIVMSDHGFSPFTREFNLSSWLVEEGFTVLDDSVPQEEVSFFSAVDWSQTKAYAMGLNGLYINLKGREQFGSVALKEAEAVKRDICARLVDARDPDTGNLVVQRAYLANELYKGPFVSLAPDIVVGYRRGYRISDEATLGRFPLDIVSDRTDKWAADHCMDAGLVPGVLLTNREVQAGRPGLWDLGPTILKEFGLATPSEMEGRPIFKG